VGISLGALLVLGLVIAIILGRSDKGEDSDTVADQNTVQQSDQSFTDNLSPGKTDGANGTTDKSDGADNDSGNRQPETSAADDQENGTTQNGETTNPFETIEQPNSKPDSGSEQTAETNDTPKSQPDNSSKPVEVETPEKQPLPTDEQQKPVLATLEETFNLSEERSREDKCKLAAELLKLAKTAQDPVEKFVLLRGTVKYASEGGDARLMMQAIDAIDRDFEIDRLNVGRIGLLGFADSANTSDALGSLVDVATDFIDTAIAQDRYELANDVADVVYKSVLKRSTGAKYRKQAYDQRNRVKDLTDRWQEIHSKLEQLKTTPADPELNLFAGKWYCLDSGNWKVGLPLLARGSDERLAKVAELELESRGNTIEEQLTLGDGWWDAAEQMQGETRKKLQRRAAYWYLKARRGVTDNLAAVKLDKRIAEVGDVETIREQIRGDAPVPEGKRVLLIFEHPEEAKFAQQACEQYFLKCDNVKSFDMKREDYSDYHTIIAGSNNMNYWKKGEPKEPDAFDHIERFVNEGGHLIVFGSYNAGGTEHLKRFGIKTSFYHTSTFERNGRATELLIAGNEDIVPDGKMQSAGNFTVSVPHVVLLKRGPGSYEGDPALATLRHKQGRVTYTLCEPVWKGDMWLITVLLSWVSRGSPTPDSGPTTSFEAEQSSSKR